LDISVYDPESHIGTGDDEGNVILRLHHIQNGIASHVLNLDFVWLQSGEFTGATTNLLGYAKYIFADNDFNGTGDFYTTGNIEGANLSSAALTEGSVVFTGADGILADDNTKFYWDDTNDRLGIGATSTDAKLAVTGGYVDIVLTGKNGLGESGVLQTKSDGKTIGDALGWNFNLRGSNDASANYAKFVIGITDPTAGALKGYFSVHTVGAVDGIVERLRVSDVGNLTVTGTLEATGLTTVADGSVTKTSAAPTTDAMIANKKYVDDQVVAGGMS